MRLNKGDEMITINNAMRDYQEMLAALDIDTIYPTDPISMFCCLKCLTRMMVFAPKHIYCPQCKTWLGE